MRDGQPFDPRPVPTPPLRDGAGEADTSSRAPAPAASTARAHMTTRNSGRGALTRRVVVPVPARPLSLAGMRAVQVGDDPVRVTLPPGAVAILPASAVDDAEARGLVTAHALTLPREDLVAEVDLSGALAGVPAVIAEEAQNIARRALAEHLERERREAPPVQVVAEVRLPDGLVTVQPAPLQVLERPAARIDVQRGPDGRIRGATVEPEA